jgi:hypothetical protein
MCNAMLIFLIPIVSCILLWFGFSGLNNNRVYVKGGRYIEKDASPINYWLNVGVSNCGYWRALLQFDHMVSQVRICVHRI